MELRVNRAPLTIKIGESPFKIFAEAEEACNALLKHLTKQN